MGRRRRGRSRQRALRGRRLRRSTTPVPPGRRAGRRRPRSTRSLPRSRTRRWRTSTPDSSRTDAHCGLGPLDPRQPVRRHLDAVGDPRGEAGGGRLVPGRQPPALEARRTSSLVEAGVQQRRDRATLGGRPDARPEPRDRVVGVGAGRDVGDAALGRRADRASRSARPCRSSSARPSWRGSPRAPSRGCAVSAARRRARPRSPGPGRARPPAASRSSRWRRRRRRRPGCARRRRAARRCRRRR